MSHEYYRINPRKQHGHPHGGSHTKGRDWEDTQGLKVKTFELHLGGHQDSDRMSAILRTTGKFQDDPTSDTGVAYEDMTS